MLLLAMTKARVIDRNEQDYLIGGFHNITRLVLRQQINDFKGQAPTFQYGPHKSRPGM